VLAVAIAAIQTTRAQDAKATLDGATQAMGATNLTSIQFTGSGTNNSYGQPWRPDMPWPAFKVTSYTAAINYATPAARLEIDRTNPDGLVRGGGGLPLLAPQKQIQAVSGRASWNVAAAPAAGAPAATPAQGALNDRLLAIWTTPHGVIKAAQANNAAVAGRVISFTLAGVPVRATLGSDNLVQTVETRADAAVLGDVLTVTTYSNYRDFGGVKFPTRIVQKQAGFPVLDLTITDVKPNASVAIDVPQNVQQAAAQPAAPPPVTVTAQKLADGVYYLTGGSHHSVAIEFNDHVIVFESPQNDNRAVAVFEAVKKTIPNKPIRYVVNTHSHFDHLGGIRAAMAEGYTIVTQAQNKGYYEKVVAASSHTINPDRLAKSPKKPAIETVGEKRVFTDGTQTLELYRLSTNHCDGMLVGYLPKAKILIEVDMFNAPAPNAPPPTAVSPVTRQLNDGIERLKLDVQQIAALHGPRVATIAELQAAAALAKSGTN
jgi:glyoxylase-like metal-dependent hydrolase (beta-lactamase superfamily II)